MAPAQPPTHPTAARVFKPKPKTQTRKLGGHAPQAQ